MQATMLSICTIDCSCRTCDTSASASLKQQPNQRVSVGVTGVASRFDLAALSSAANTICVLCVGCQHATETARAARNTLV